MSQYIAQAMLQGLSGLPKDEFENIFHFVGAPGAANLQDAGNIVYRLYDFYDNGTIPISSFLGNVGSQLTIKVYDEAATKPRPELLKATMTLRNDPSPLAVPVPPEVALCLSYYSSTNTNGRRGRVYLGPWQVSALTAGTATGDIGQSRPAPDLISSMVAAGTRLANDPDAAIPDPTALTFYPLYEPAFAYSNTANWALRTTKGGVVYRLIDHGWVDNEWDGQSRRRVESSARQTFAIS